MNAEPDPRSTGLAMGTSPGLAAQLGAVVSDIKLHHTVFALPFAVLATFLAAGSVGRLPSAAEFGLILWCMVMARTAAMAMNRWADVELDAANPRTAGRAAPSGRVSRGVLLGVVAGCATLLWLGAGGFNALRGNPWPAMLTPGVLVVLLGYSFTKRWTWLCHAVLGLALGLSPLAAAVAIEPGYLAGAAPWLIAGLVLCWVAGFDVIYALQDVGVDREHGLFSMPASLGEERALWVSRSLHALVVACLVLLIGVSPQLGAWFIAAAAMTAALLGLEHALVWGSRTNRLHHAFFTLNGVISLALGAAGVVDVVRGVWG